MDEIELRRGDIAFQDMDSYIPKGLSDIEKFYAGTEVFVTGGTGFLGKLIIEKLLRSCPDIKKIYVLVRPKKGKNVETRFKEMFNEVIFVHVMKDRLEPPEKVEAITGDCSMLGLGISEENKIKLQNGVNIVFHCAATVRFDEKFKIAVNTNVRGTRELLQLAKSIKNLQALVHISTAYCHCPRQDIDEKFYPVPIEVESVIKLAECMDENTIETSAQVLLKPWPNSYSYTKAVAEEAVRIYGTGMPVVIVRPSVVVSTAREPVAGWIDNVYGATGVVVGAAVGLLRTLNCDPGVIADLVPADYVVNSAIVAAWDVAIKSDLHTAMEPKIFNYVSCAQNPLKWDRFMELSFKYGSAIPLSMAIWYHDCLILSKNKHMHDIRVILRHTLPAILADLWLRIIGKKPMLVDAYRKIHKFSAVLQYFTTKEWNFTNQNTQKLAESLSLADSTTFQFDISQLNWEEYMDAYVKGGRIYLMKDGVETIPAAIKRMKKLQIAHYTLMAILWFGLFYVLWKLFSLISFDG